MNSNEIEHKVLCYFTATSKTNCTPNLSMKSARNIEYEFNLLTYTTKSNYIFFQ